MRYKKEKKTFKIFTLGCKVNQWESAYIASSLEDMGWKPTSLDAPCTLAIVNTCIVTQKAAHQSRQAIRKMIRENPNAMVVVTGCYAQVYPQELRDIPGVGGVVGNTWKHLIPSLIREGRFTEKSVCLVSPFDKRGALEPLLVRRFMGRTRAYLKIQDGCEVFCSYCIVPKGRGPYRSLEPAHVISMLEALAAEGFREVVLTGIHLGKYGVDLQAPISLVGLLHRIGERRFPLRIRLSSVEPGEVTEELIDLVGSESWLCRHFHIPLQSGDRGILEKMNRNYTPQDYEALIRMIRTRIPLAAIGADVMIGFPGETDMAFRHTYDFVSNIPISYLHVFPFSPRQGTPAAFFPGQVPPHVAKQRGSALRRLGQKKREDFMKSCLGKEFEILVEGWSSRNAGLMQGLTDNYLRVQFSATHCQEGDLITLTLAQHHLVSPVAISDQDTSTKAEMSL